MAYWNDADNWSGMPLVGGNVGGSKAERGNLTHLKRAGLIKTHIEREDNTTWIIFTDAGKEFAKQLEAASAEPESSQGETMKTTKKPTTTKTTKPATTTAKSAPKPKPATGSHAFLSASAEEPLKCATCGEAPSGKLHRRYMDAARALWRNGSAAERRDYLTHLAEAVSPAEARLTWTALPSSTKRGLAACVDLEAVGA